MTQPDPPRPAPLVRSFGPITNPPFRFRTIEASAGGLVVGEQRGVWKEQVYTIRTLANVRVDPHLGRAFIDDEPVAETLLRAPKGPPQGRVRPFSTTARAPFLAFNANWRGYYHWLFQTMFAMWAIETLDPDPARLHLLPEASDGWRAMLGALPIPPERIAFFPDRRHRLLKRLTVSNFPTAGPTTLMRRFGESLAMRLRVDPGATRAIYVSRRDSDKRPITNEAEVEAAMATAGIRTVLLSELDLRAKMELFSGCDLVVGPHGAGLAHMVFCRPGTRLLEIFPAWLPSRPVVRSAMCSGMDYTLMRIPGVERPDRSWDVPVDVVTRVATAILKGEPIV